MAEQPAGSDATGNTEEDWQIFEILCKDMKVSST